MSYSNPIKQKKYQSKWYQKNKKRLSIDAKKYREINRDKINKRQREFYLLNRVEKIRYEKERRNNDKYKEYKKKYDIIYYDVNKEKIKKRTYRYTREKYGITLEQYDNMFRKQKGKCPICNNPLGKLGIGTGPCIDHSHLTKKVRDLLCRKCNLGLGLFKDNPKILESAVKYLYRHLG